MNNLHSKDRGEVSQVFENEQNDQLRKFGTMISAAFTLLFATIFLAVHSNELPVCSLCDGNEIPCIKGTVCGIPQGGGAKKCIKQMIEGMSCNDPCWTCKDGLTCVDEGTDHICRLPYLNVCALCGDGIAGRCGPATNLVCDIPQGGGPTKCVKLMAEGQACNDPCWKCNEGLSCRESGSQKLCVAPPVLSKCGEHCSWKKGCEQGLSCSRKYISSFNYSYICQKTVGEGEACDGTCSECENGTRCDSTTKKCTKSYYGYWYGHHWSKI